VEQAGAETRGKRHATRLGDRIRCRACPPGQSLSLLGLGRLASAVGGHEDFALGPRLDRPRARGRRVAIRGPRSPQVDAAYLPTQPSRVIIGFCGRKLQRWASASIVPTDTN
jgi:hypothetical protein